MNRAISFFSGAIMGALVGATLGILLTPVSGEELRNKMEERKERLQEEVKSAAESRRIELEEQLSKLRQPDHSSG